VAVTALEVPCYLPEEWRDFEIPWYLDMKAALGGQRDRQHL
jgi:hypothetical protein